MNFKCQICYAPMLFDERFCPDCWERINKYYEERYKDNAMIQAIRKYTLEVREKQYQDRINEGK